LPEPDRQGEAHIAILDGWRALSILLVLFSHWFPTPRAWQLNQAAGAAGMALFFTLSGFLITRLLLRDARIAPFLIRRLMRIVPLAWAAVAILCLFDRPNLKTALANFLFFANLPPAHLMNGGSHLWSLCVEVQFYVCVALLAGIAGRRSLVVLPLLAVSVTALRILDQQPISIVTWHRVDEILAGASVALAIPYMPRLMQIFKSHAWLCVCFLMGLFLSSHPESGWLQYLRPYFAAAAVGTSIFAAPALMRRVFTSRAASYFAQISYALYVVHGMLTATWLGGEHASKTTRYMLRPVLAAASVAFAHLSTFYYEKHWIAWGKKLAGSKGVGISSVTRA